MERARPDGVVLRWNLALNALDGGPVPFLIAWGDTAHPATTAPSGLQLHAFSIAAPDPDAVMTALRALGIEMHVDRAATTTLVALLEGPDGTVELR
jgi:hypothetical protein